MCLLTHDVNSALCYFCLCLDWKHSGLSSTISILTFLLLIFCPGTYSPCPYYLSFKTEQEGYHFTLHVPTPLRKMISYSIIPYRTLYVKLYYVLFYNDTYIKSSRRYIFFFVSQSHCFTGLNPHDTLKCMACNRCSLKILSGSN